MKTIQMASVGRRICAGGIQPVRVVHGDGQVLQLAPLVKVADILSRHPHHYICHSTPDLPSNRSVMLPLDTELEPGCVYFLLPLPRLFPSSNGSYVPSCSCYTDHERNQAGVQPNSGLQKSGFSPLIIKQIMGRFGSPLRMPKKKVSPEYQKTQSSNSFSSNPFSDNYSPSANGKENVPLLSPTYGNKRSSSPKRSTSPNQLTNRSRNTGNSIPLDNMCHRWKPRLGCISETDAFVAACEEMRLALERRRLMYENRGRPPSPLRNVDHSRDICKSPRNTGALRETYSIPSPKHSMPLSGYVFV